MSTLVLNLRVAAFIAALFCISSLPLLCGQVVDDKDADNATTVQLPTLGVSIDSNGVLSFKSVVDPTGNLRAERVRAARASLGGDVARPSKLRKISLRRLESAVRERMKQGKKPSDTMRFLAGLTRIEYAFICPEQHDIIVAGPAEGWMDDGVGRIVGIKSGTPTVQLEDLIVAMKAFFWTRVSPSTKCRSLDCLFNRSDSRRLAKAERISKNHSGSGTGKCASPGRGTFCDGSSGESWQCKHSRARDFQTITHGASARRSRLSYENDWDRA